MRTLIVAVIVAVLLATCSGRPWGPIKQKFRRDRYQKETGGGQNGGGQNGGGQNGQNGGGQNGQNGGGQNGGGQNGGGQNGGSNGPNQWLNELQIKCTLNLTSVAEQKVTPMDVMDVLYDLYVVVGDAASNFSDHSDMIDALAGGLENQTLSELVTSHTVLVTHFLDLVDAASDAGFCPIGHLRAILQRLKFNGGDGFSEMDSCGESFLATQALAEQYGSMEDAYSSIDATWLHAFGGYIRADMQCVTRDIQTFKHKIIELIDLFIGADSGDSDDDYRELTMRRVELDVATINAYAGVLQREIRRLKSAVFDVGTALDHIDIAALAQTGGSRDMSRILQLLKLLRTA